MKNPQKFDEFMDGIVPDLICARICQCAGRSGNAVRKRRKAIYVLSIHR